MLPSAPLLSTLGGAVPGPVPVLTTPEPTGMMTASKALPFPEQTLDIKQKFSNGIDVELPHDMIAPTTRTMGMVNELHTKPDGEKEEDNYKYHFLKMKNVVFSYTSDHWPEDLPDATVRFARVQDKDGECTYTDCIDVMVWTSEEECRANASTRFSFIATMTKKGMKLSGLEDGRVYQKVVLKDTVEAQKAVKKDAERRRNQLRGRGITKRERFIQTVFPCFPPIVSRSDTEVMRSRCLEKDTMKALHGMTLRERKKPLLKKPLLKRDAKLEPLLYSK